MVLAAHGLGTGMDARSGSSSLPADPAGAWLPKYCHVVEKTSTLCLGNCKLVYDLEPKMQ